MPLLNMSYIVNDARRNILMLCSTGNQGFYYGVVSHYKNLQTSVLETKLIMEKAGRCLSIMGLTSSTTSLYQQRLRKI
jgi:hypothetical protein